MTRGGSPEHFRDFKTHKLRSGIWHIWPGGGFTGDLEPAEKPKMVTFEPRGDLTTQTRCMNEGVRYPMWRNVSTLGTSPPLSCTWSPRNTALLPQSDHFWLASWLQVPSEPTSWPNVPNMTSKFVRFEVPEMVTQATTRHTNEL